MYARIDHIDGKASRDLGDRRDRLSVYPERNAVLIEASPDARDRLAVAVLDIDGQLVAPVLNEPSGLPSAKRSPAADQKEGLEQARFARTVRSEEVVAPGIEATVDVLQDP